MDDATCRCLVCTDDYTTQDAFLAEGAVLNGFTPMAIATSVPFAYTIGLWHSFRWPEVVMFGLEPRPMGSWLSKHVELAKANGRPDEGQPFTGVIDNYSTQLRTVDRSWNDALFGTLYRFYNGVFPPVQQLVWPDMQGVWPWQAGGSPGSRKRQAQAWLPVADHPEGGWRLFGELEPGFPLSGGPDQEVLTTRSVAQGERQAVAIVNDGEELDVLDERGYQADDFMLAYIGNLVAAHPHLLSYDDTRTEQRGTYGTHGSWSYRPLAVPDRKASTRLWQQVIDAENEANDD